MKSQTTVALKVCLRQLQMSNTFQVNVNVKYPEVTTKALKSLLPFQHPVFMKQGFFFAVTATEMRLPSRLDISNTLQDHCLSSPQTQPSSCRKTSLGFPLILLYNIIGIACT